MKLTIIGPNLPDQSKGGFHVHAAGCADLRRGMYRRLHNGHFITEDHDTVREVVDSIYGPDAGGFYEESGLDPETAWKGYADDFYFAPCTAVLPEDRPPLKYWFEVTINPDGHTRVDTADTDPRQPSLGSPWAHFETFPTVAAAAQAVAEEIVYQATEGKP